MKNSHVPKPQQNDKEKTAWVNKEVGRAYNAAKADKNEYKALEDRTISYNKANGMSGLESLVIFGSSKYRNNWKLRHVATDLGYQFIDEMNAKSNSDSNFYAFQERFDHFCKPLAFGTSQ
ncbi:hypothetical protein BDC45DRAFT_569018 [Circinella umbellata]|nr:hypothetical protein BDC45DRAFT_569018 [Circinella umbellata]